MKVFNKIINYIMFFFSYSPFCCLSDDENFGSNEKGTENFIDRIRISMFSFNLGANKYYFISKKRGESIKFIHRINLEDIYIMTPNKRQDLIKSQDSHLKDATDLKYDKEFLKYCLENENKRKNISFNKINMYSGIILAVIPLILIFFKPESFLKAPIVVKTLTFILMYILLNMVCLILQSNNVRGIVRETYGDFKLSTDKEKSIIHSYYMDWQYLKREADRVVSFVKNIDKHLKGILIISVLILLVNSISYIIPKYSLSQNQDECIEINIDRLEQRKEEEIQKINIFNKQIVNDNVKQVIILYSNNEMLENKSFKSIYNYFLIYRNENKIKLIKDSNDNLNNTIRIILVEG